MPKCQYHPKTEMKFAQKVPATYGGQEGELEIYRCPLCGLMAQFFRPRKAEKPKKKTPAEAEAPAEGED